MTVTFVIVHSRALEELMVHQVLREVSDHKGCLDQSAIKDHQDYRLVVPYALDRICAVHILIS